jgi:hypothetical protein
LNFIPTGYRFTTAIIYKKHSLITLKQQSMSYSTTKAFIRIALVLFIPSLLAANSYGHTAGLNEPVIDTTPLVRPVTKISPGSMRVNLGTTLTKRQWLTTLNLIMLTLKLKINNYTPTAFAFTRDNTYKFLKPDDCSLSIGLPGEKVTHNFSLAASRQEPATMYFIDIRNQSQTVDVAGSQIKISVKFEEAGHEVLANCIDNVICGGGMWWADLAQLKTDIYLTPAIEDGKLTYSTARVVASGQIRSAGFNAVIGFIERYENQGVFNRASEKFTAILNDPAIKSTITHALNSNLSRLPVQLPNPLRSVVIEPDGDLVFNKPGTF